MEYLKFKKRPHPGFYDPSTGKELQSVEGRYNRKGIDEFEVIHDPDKYPKCVMENQKQTKAWIDRGDGFIILKMDISGEEHDSILLKGNKDFDMKDLTQEEIELINPESGATVPPS